MSTIKQYIDELLDITNKLNMQVTEANEFTTVAAIQEAINQLELAIHEARKTFERTKNIDSE